MVNRRLDAGWDFDPEYGWASPDGVNESDWADNGWPMPEDAEFSDWFRATYHHDALDAGVECNPYPNAPATAGE